MDADGVMYFVGRRDRQAKVRGYRIELDEIELALVAHEAVEEAAVYAVADAEGQAEVHGAIRANGNPGPTPDDIAHYLRAHLPWYALPAKLRLLDDFPRTTTGKIDRRALSEEEGE